MTASFTEKFQLIFIFVSVMIGVLAAAYFYLSTGIFMERLKRPLRLVSWGMIVMTIDVLLAAFITYESSVGVRFALYGVPLEAFFLVIYIAGSILIGLGAHGFTHRAVA